MEVGDEVNMSVRGRRIVVEPVKKVRGKYDLKALVLRMPKDYRAEEVDWGSPVGKEERKNGRSYRVVFPTWRAPMIPTTRWRFRRATSVFTSRCLSIMRTSLP